MIYNIVLSIFALFIINTHISYCTEDYELEHIQIIYRHGDRSPIKLYPTDPNSADYWREGLGKLTMTGRKQHYALGKFLRNFYKNFITTSPLEIVVTSSEEDRCFRSAQTNTASFFAPSPNWRFETDFDWQPIFIKYVPKDDDMYLETSSICPAATKEKERVISSPEGQAFIAEHKEMFGNLSHFSGNSIKDWISSSYLHDTIYIEKKYNLTVPDWATVFWEEMSNVSNLSFFWSFNSPLLHRLRAGPMIGLLTKNMKDKISGFVPHEKVQVFSTHDTNLAVIQVALGVFNMVQPPYCSAIIFELHKKDNDRAVRLLYFNSSTPEDGDQVPHVLTLPGCSEYCPFEIFINRTKDLIPEDWKKECQVKREPFDFTETGFISTIVIALIIVCSLFGICCICNKYRVKLKNSADEYSYHLMVTE